MEVIQEFNGSVLVDGAVLYLDQTQNQIDAMTTVNSVTAYAIAQNGDVWQIRGTNRTNLSGELNDSILSLTAQLNTKLNTVDLLDKIYPVGSLYMSVGDVSPASFIGGSWSKIVDDAYLKIVPTGAGELGGTSSTHQIPVASLPPHGHMLNVAGGGITADTVAVGWTASREISGIVRNTGSGNPYHPYYFGINLWKRIA